MLSRRLFIQIATMAGANLFFKILKTNASDLPVYSQWFMPDEGEPHKRTWMAFIAADDIWEKRQIPEVQQNLADIAKTIAKYEPVSMLVRKQDKDTAVKFLGGLNRSPYSIDLIEFTMNDLWIRDTGPTFVINKKGEKAAAAAIDFNFNGWGEDQDYELDAGVADFVAQKAGVKTMNTDLILEGGCFEVDGQGTAIMSESCILNDNRNPNKSKEDVEYKLKDLLGLDKIIWLKGIRGKDITDGHTDFYARFAGPGTVIVSRDTDQSSYDYRVTRENIDILGASTDANGNPLKLVIIDTPWHINERYGTKSFAAGYVGYYVCNHAVIMQKFGDVEADASARKKLSSVFPNHFIEQISIDGIASGGGSIHCATQQEPKA